MKSARAIRPSEITAERHYLHRLVYLIAILGVWHFYWQVKQDILEPVIYTAILFTLLGFRVVVAWRRTRRFQPNAEGIAHARTAHTG